MDLTDIKPQGREVEIVTPTGQHTGVVINLRAPDAKEIKAFERKIEDAVLRNRGKLPTKERRTFKVDRVIAGIEGWSFKEGAMEISGEKEPEFSERKMRDLLKIEWIRNFLDSEMGDEATFFENLGTD